MQPTETLDDPRYQLGVISGKLDLILVQMAEADRRHDRRFTDIETRIAAVEEGHAAYGRDRSWLLGGGAAVTAALGGLATWLGLR